MLRAYKHRIYPTLEQKVLMEKHFGCCRWVYNYALGKKKDAWELNKTDISINSIEKQITQLKKIPETAWLSEVSYSCLGASLTNLDKAYRSFFKKNSGHPNFKHKTGAQSFTVRFSIKIDYSTSLLAIPKMKEIPIKVSRGFNGEIRLATISKTTAGKYFASILVEDGRNLPVKPEIKPEATIGIDLGLKEFAIMDNGGKIENPRFLRNDLTRLRVLQARASRKKKGSNNRRKANKKVAIRHERISNKRADFIHKLTYKLTHESQVDTICIEKLRVENMLKNHKLAQAISDVSWSAFVTTLKYKCDWYGKNLIQIGTFQPSSKTCSNCGNINKELKLSHREWQCTTCLVTHDRDVNAAKNIKFMGLSGAASSVVPVESSTLVEAVKQEIFAKDKNTGKN